MIDKIFPPSSDLLHAAHTHIMRSGPYMLGEKVDPYGTSVTMVVVDEVNRYVMSIGNMCKIFYIPLAHPEPSLIHHAHVATDHTPLADSRRSVYGCR